VFDLCEHGFDDRGTLPVDASPAGRVELGDHAGRQARRSCPASPE
jgi:hypothetical protein